MVFCRTDFQSVMAEANRAVKVTVESVEETEDETREENRDHQREGHHESDQQPGADPASDAAPVLLLPGEVAEAPEEAALLGWVVACHGRSL